MQSTITTTTENTNWRDRAILNIADRSQPPVNSTLINIEQGDEDCRLN